MQTHHNTQSTIEIICLLARHDVNNAIIAAIDEMKLAKHKKQNLPSAEQEDIARWIPDAHENDDDILLFEPSKASADLYYGMLNRKVAEFIKSAPKHQLSNKTLHAIKSLNDHDLNLLARINGESSNTVGSWRGA